VEQDRGYLPFYDIQGHARARLGVRESRQGRAAAPFFELGVEDFQCVLRLDPTSETWLCRGSLYLQWIRTLVERGEDPVPIFDRMKEGFRPHLRDDVYVAWLMYGLALRSLGDYLDPRRGDPRPYWREARSSFQKALKSGQDPETLRALEVEVLCKEYRWSFPF
jgi:hypothetical protein